MALKTSQQKGLVAEDSVLALLAAVAVVLRFWSRRLSRAGYWWDDFMSIVALVGTGFEGSDSFAD